ncbi:MAG: DNA-directed RNA polymerase subunit beta', partial [Anaerolineae bacterium]|nr:DNA-directed RNA polymerase subunit beta' [Anaerolineae bacterium]
KAGQKLAINPDNSDEVLVSGMAGEVYIEGHTLYIRDEVEDVGDYDLPQTARLLDEIHDGMQVEAGQQLTEGPLNPHRILRILGQEFTQHYMLSEVQKVYRNQGVNISDKHFEVVIRKMLSKVQITLSGGSELLPGELIDKLALLELNERLLADNAEPAAAVPVLLGVTKAALTTDSFLSASSFQHTIKVLAGAAIEGKVDKLFGLKENVIIGKLIPAGTGFHAYQDRELAVNNQALEQQTVVKGEDDDDDIDLDLVVDGDEEIHELGQEPVVAEDEVFEEEKDDDFVDGEDKDELVLEDDEEESLEAVAEEEDAMDVDDED